ncbi:MAG: DUF58 domain-containing protein [Clostridiales Family XIII bacterium]|jgi:uncharacterized protein (DUF58 family)|nr:DUF58 domain-containing protein [Clostridiales Family XIII bacterium]
MRAPGTKRTIMKVALCALAFCALALPALFMDTVYGWLPLLFGVSALGLCALYLLALRHTLAFEESSEAASCRRGDAVPFELRLQNRSLLVFPRVEVVFYISDLFGGDDVLNTATVTLAPRERRAFGMDLRFDHIGTYEAGLRRVVLHDPLGLFSCTLENRLHCRVDVRPRIFPMENLHFAEAVLTESERQLVPISAEGSDYTGVREYVMGDPIKTIHWKLSARQENYLTKQYENYGTTGVTIFLDLCSPPYPAETLMDIYDTLVEAAFSVGNRAEGLGTDCEIVYTDRYGRRRRYSRGRMHESAELIADMPRIHVGTGAEAEAGIAMLREEGMARYTHGNIVFCTAHVTQGTADALIELRRARRHPLLIAVQPEDGDEAGRRLVQKAVRALEFEGIPCHCFTPGMVAGFIGAVSSAVSCTAPGAVSSAMPGEVSGAASGAGGAP